MDVEGLPGARFLQGGGEASGGVAEESDARNSRERAAGAQDEIRVEMTDDGGGDLVEVGLDGGFGGEVGEGGGIVEEEEDRAAGRQGVEGGADFGEVLLAEGVPGGAFGFEGFGFVSGECEQARGHSEEDELAEVAAPERFEAEFGEALPAGETESAALAEEAELAEFVVTDDGLKAMAEVGAETREAKLGALECGGVAEADEGGVAGKIAVADDEVGGVGGGEEVVEEMVMGEGITEPDEVSVGSGGVAEEWVWDGAGFVAAARLLGVAGKVDVAEDGELHPAG